MRRALAGLLRAAALAVAPTDEAPRVRVDVAGASTQWELDECVIRRSMFGGYYYRIKTRHGPGARGWASTLELAREQVRIELSNLYPFATGGTRI